MAVQPGSSSYQIVLLGGPGSGKDTFLDALPALSGKNGIDIGSITGYRILEDGSQDQFTRNKTDEELPEPTTLSEVRTTLVTRKDKKQGVHAFCFPLALSNKPGILINEIRRGRIDPEYIKRAPPQTLNIFQMMALKLQEVQFLIIMLDVAYELACFGPRNARVIARDRELASDLNQVFELFGALGVRLENIPTAFCVTKIDGKFLDADDVLAMSYVADVLIRIEDYLSRNRKSDQILPPDDRNTFRALVSKAETYWPGDSFSDEWPLTVEDLRLWYEERAEALERENNDDTLELQHKDSDGLKALFEEMMPRTHSVIHRGPYQGGGCQYFAISAVGRGYRLGISGEPINIQQVMNFIIKQAEVDRQHARPVPPMLKKFSLFLRHKALLPPPAKPAAERP